MFVRNELHRTAVLEGLRNGLTLVNLPGMTPKTCSNTSDPVNSSAIARPASMREKPSQIVLIVEDDRITREGLSAILTREGYQTVLAADGREGLECLRRGVTPGLILLDMMMPKRSGFLVLEKLRRTRVVPIRVIMILSLIHI